jgi:hypothetical protein
MTAQPETKDDNDKATAEAEAERPELATDEAVAACGGDMRATVRALIVAVEFLEAEMERQVSHGFRRSVKHGRFNTHRG